MHGSFAPEGFKVTCVLWLGGGRLCGVTSTSLCTAKLISLFVFVLVIQQTALYLFSVKREM
jgi:hypothetical protein